MENYKTLIFDLDGTLVNSMNAHAQIFGLILWEKYGVEKGVSERGYLDSAGMPLDEQFMYVLDLCKKSPKHSINTLITEFWSQVENSSYKLFPDVEPVINLLATRDYQLCVSSSADPVIVKSKLSKLGILKNFCIALGTDKDIPYLVKGAGHFKIICETLKLTHNEFIKNSIMVGDGAYDMKIAKEAGILAIGRITGDNKEILRSAGANLLIHDLFGLYDYLVSSGK